MSSGRYVWNITVTSETGLSEIDKHLTLIGYIDATLKEKFPEFARKGSGRVTNLDEE